MSTELRNKILECLEIANKYVYGQEELLKALVSGIICEGHILVEGMPGLGKTQSISIMSQLGHLKFKRVQFTPDLMPSDLIGTLVFGMNSEDFKVKFGPLFTQILLADEVNRAPAKVQAALLEAMEERQVTIGDQTYPLTSPFVVMATQNPIENEGTFVLPEAQLDRFMMKVYVGYPSFEAERKILERNFHAKMELAPILSTDDILNIRDEVQKIYVDEKIKELIVKIVHATRPPSEFFDKELKDLILHGASPRATLWLFRLARFNAYLNNKDFVSLDNVVDVAQSVIAHRLVLSYEANLQNISSRDLVSKIVDKIISKI